MRKGKVLKDPQHRSLWGVGACHLPACGCVHQQGSCPDLIAYIFYGGSITEDVWLNHRLWVCDPISSPYPFPWAPGGKASPLSSRLDCADLLPASCCYLGPQPPVISLASKRHSYHSGDSKGFSNCVPGRRDNNQACISYYATVFKTWMLFYHLH